MSRGQVSIEYMLVTAFAFLFAVPIIATFYAQSHQMNEDIGSAQADRVVSEIVNAANEVYYLGEPSKKTVLVYFPQTIKNMTVMEKEVNMVVGSRAGGFDVARVSAANLTGTIRPTPGLHRIEVEARLFDVLITDK